MLRDNLSITGQAVNLSRIRIPYLDIIAAHDHIVPPACASALRDCIGDASYTEISLPTGHIGAFVSAASQPVTVPQIAAWLDKHTTS